MTWNLKRPQELTIKYPQDDGSVETVTYMMQYKSPKQECDSCERSIEPIFKCARPAEDWIWLECDTCNEAFCDKCATDVKEGTVVSARWGLNLVVECNSCSYQRHFTERLIDAKQYALPLPY